MSKLLPLLINATGLSDFDLRIIISNAPLRYKVFPIKKRNGGNRIIAQPARELKTLQRALIECFLSNLPIHDAATAYRSGISIADNAKAHSASGPIKKYDFRDFFHSIRAKDWRSYCDRRNLFDNDLDYIITEKILFQRDKGSKVLKLSIGAPSSPMLSNILMFEFDTAITEALAKDKVTYTRYADDLTFSARRTGHLTVIDRTLRKTIRDVPWPQLEINEQKTVLATKKYRREVTGLILTNDGDVSLGREKKRRIRAALHHAMRGTLSQDELAHLSGMLAFSNAVEPEFLRRMEAHYGSELISQVKQYGRFSKRKHKIVP